jgi:hypothetical protein
MKLIRSLPSNVSVYREIDTETGETRLYCHSEQKAKKEQGIRNRFHACPERVDGFAWKRPLDQLNAGLDKKGTIKNYAKIPVVSLSNYSNASAGCAKKTAVSHKTTAMR